MEEKIINNIKSLRTRAGFTQEETAKQLGISRPMYLFYENHPKKMRLDLAMKLSFILNCTIDDFYLDKYVTKSRKGE